MSRNSLYEMVNCMVGFILRAVYAILVAQHHEIHRITDTDEHTRDFLFQEGILKTSVPTVLIAR